MSLTSNVPYLTVWDAKLNVRPRRAVSDPGNSLLRYSVELCEGSAAEVAAFYGFCGSLVYFGIWVLAAAWPCLWLDMAASPVAGGKSVRLPSAVVHISDLHSSFFNGIENVLAVCPKKQMPWIAAGRVVACVTDEKVAFPDIISQKECNGRGVVIGTTNAKSPILDLVSGWPALINSSNADLFPESSNVGGAYTWLGKRFSIHVINSYGVD